MNEQWVFLRTYATIVEAQIMRAVLDANEIDAVIPDENFISIRPELAIGQGGIRVLVRKSQLDEATRIVQGEVGDPAAMDDQDGDLASPT